MPLKSDSWRQSLNSHCSKMVVNNDDRSKLAAGLLYTSNLHHYSIIELSMKNMLGSAFALLRPQLETYIRAVWVMNCASAEAVQKFCAGEEPPRINVQLREIEELEEFSGGHLSTYKNQVWALLCDFTHGGGVQAAWHIGNSFVGCAFTHLQVKSLYQQADTMALKSSLAIAKLCNNEEIAKIICASHKRIFNINV